MAASISSAARAAATFALPFDGGSSLRQSFADFNERDRRAQSLGGIDDRLGVGVEQGAIAVRCERRIRLSVAGKILIEDFFHYGSSHMGS